MKALDTNVLVYAEVATCPFHERAGCGASGNLVFDAQIAMLCIEHGVSELYSGDRDFARFAGLRVTNPFR